MEYEKPILAQNEDPIAPSNPQELSLSNIQSLISELFRLQLCRNDDHNLAQSSILKGLQIKDENKRLDAKKTKLISDVKSRESDRIKREKEILSLISGEANQSKMLENESMIKHIKKFVRKMLLLTVSDQY